MSGRIGAATCDHRPRAAIRSPLPVAGSSETLASAGYSATTATSGLLLDEIFEPHTFAEAAAAVLRRARRPMTANQITKAALAGGLIKTAGRTPYKTMEARLYASANARLLGIERVFEPGIQRARRGSVRWRLRR